MQRNTEFTDSHMTAFLILQRNHVICEGEYTIHLWGHFDHKNRPQSAKCDIVVNDPKWGAGVIEIDGAVHHQEAQAKWDIKKDAMLRAMGLWVERIDNRDAHRVMEYLEKHRRRVDEYGGAY